MIHVIALITAKPGQRAALLDRFSKVLPLVHAEPGCIQYEPVIDAPGTAPFETPAGPDTFIVVERWESAEALRTHVATPHMVEYNTGAAELITSATLYVMTPALPPPG